MKSRHPRAPRPAATAPSRPSLDQRLAKLHRLRLNGPLTAPHGRRLRHEQLEDRRLLALITVTTVDDVVDFNDGRTSLREAVFAANIVPGPDEIRFDFGHDGPAIISLSDGAIAITESLTITGPGRDLLIIDASASDPTPDTDNGDGSRIFTIETPLKPVANVALTGLTLTGGDTSDGGAIICYANLTLADVRFADNHATNRGGAIYMKLGRLDLTRAEFADNSSGGPGGAVHALGDVFVDDSDFLRNSAGATQGGALHQAGFNFVMHIVDSRFTENSAGAGGAVDASRGPLTIENSAFSANMASSVGGAIQAAAASNYPNKLVLITGSTITGNTSGKIGGGLATGGKVEIRSSTISGNSFATTGGLGGGIYHGNGFLGGSLLVVDSTVSDNSAMRGGGIYTRNAAATILSSTIQGNTAGVVGQIAGRGGGISHFGLGFQDALAIHDSTIHSNVASAYGAGVFASALSITITDSTITGNSVGQLAKVGVGGGVFLHSESSNVPRVLNSTISDNFAGRLGGGVYGLSTLLVDGCTISRNIAGNDGGGIFTRSTSTVRRSLLSENRAGDQSQAVGRGGGIYFSARSNNVIDSSTLSGNFAGRGGGGLYASIATVINSTISGNTARTGGGAQGSGLTFRHTTITGNSALFINGDLGEGGGVSGNATLDHTILAANHSADGSPDLFGRLNQGTRYSIIGDRTGSTIQAEAPIGVPDVNGNLIGGPTFGPINPLLAPLADNGGPTLPGGVALPTHALLTGSPAFNAGDPNFIPGADGVLPEFDQRGAPYARKAVLRIDIGAFEQQPAGGLFTADATGDGLTDGRDFLAWQREFGAKPPAIVFADFTGNGRVDSNDLAVWTARYGDSEIAEQSSLVPSPERGGAAGGVIEAPSGAELITIAAAAEDAPPILVTTLADEINLTDGKTSLREAIFAANIASGHQEIQFAPALFTAGPGTILLTKGELAITDSLTLTGPGANLLTVDATGSDPTPDGTSGDGARAFNIDDDDPGIQKEVSLTALTITGGDVMEPGGGILTRENLSVADAVIENNGTYFRGGGAGIFADSSTLHILRTQILNNISVHHRGAGVYVIGGSILMEDSRVAGNACVYSDGGGIYAINAEAVHIERSTIENNGASEGGGIAATAKSILIRDSTIRANTADKGGGAKLASESVTLDHCDISENTATYESGGGLDVSGNVEINGTIFKKNSAIAGGAISADDSTLRLVECELQDNHASGSGGAIRVRSSNLTIDRCTIMLNTAVRGGAVSCNRGGDLQVNDSLIERNRAAAIGGGLYVEYASGEVRRTTIAHNFADDYSAATGGGIYIISNLPFLVADSTISNNVAYDGGGISVFSSLQTFRLERSTVAYNQARTSAAGILFQFGQFDVSGSVVAANILFSGQRSDVLATNGASVNARFTILGDVNGLQLQEAPLGHPDANGNLIGGPLHGPIDPLLAPLADNGGPALPGGAKLLTHALLPGSPAIDAGDAALKPSVGDTPQFDQRGEPFSRVVGTRIDIGALEQTGVPLVVDTLLDESDGDYRRGDVSLREAILLANAQVGPDVIEFDPALFTAGGKSILLTKGELAITDSLTLTGPGRDLLTVDAQLLSRVFFVSESASDVTLAGITITGGRSSAILPVDPSSSGGAIRSLTTGKLSINDSALTGNSTVGREAGGGAVYARGGALYVTNCVVTGNGTDGNDAQGGAFLIKQGELVIAACIINNNYSSFGVTGGAVFLDRSDANIVDTQFVSNEAIYGGALYTVGADADPSSLKIQGCLFIQNAAIIDGGAIYASRVESEINDSSFEGNSVVLSDGGAIHSSSGALVINGCAFVKNHADEFSSEGGAIYVIDGMLAVEESSFSQNTSKINGGAIGAREAALDIRHSQFLDNGVEFSQGGAIFHLFGQLALEDCTFVGNSALNGGAVWLRAVSAFISQCTISANLAKEDGAGIYFDRFRAGSLTVESSTITNNKLSETSTRFGGGIYLESDSNLDLRNSIVANNSKGDVIDWNSASVIEASHNLIGSNAHSPLIEAPLGAPDANGNFIGGPIHGVIDPLLAPLADNGGPTLTHALLPGSPALNAGDPALVAGVGDTPQFDQRGEPYSRVISRIDIGAVEQIPAELLVDNLADVSDGDYRRGQLTLREAIELANLQVDHNIIRFDPAVFVPRGGTIRLSKGELKITESLDILGFDANRITIDALDNDPTPLLNNGDGSRIFNIDDGDPTRATSVFIASVTLRNGEVAGDGGAIYAAEPLGLSRVVISANAAHSGGGVYAAAGLKLGDCFVTSNVATADGAGVWARGHVEIDRTTLITNRGGQRGGALWVSGDVAIRDVTFLRNSTNLAGGSLYVASDSALNPTTALIYDSEFADSSAAQGGGAAWDLWSFVSIVNSQLVFNSTFFAPGHTPRDGAALFGEGPLVLAHSTVYNNAVQGTDPAGAAGVRVGVAFISHSVISNTNSAAYDVALLPGGHVSAVYSIIGTNAGSGLAESPAGTTDAQGNRIGGPVNGEINPLLLGSGLPTANSLTVNAGNPSLAALPPDLSDFDVRGVPFGRVIGGRIDIGAYEFQTAGGALGADFNSSGGRVDGGAFLAWQRNFGRTASATFAQGDATHDGDVDTSDYAVWKFRFGAISPTIPGAAALTVDLAGFAESSTPAPGGVQSIAESLAILKHARALDLALADANLSTRSATRPASRRAFAAGDLLDVHAEDGANEKLSNSMFDNALEALFAALR